MKRDTKNRHIERISETAVRAWDFTQRAKTTDDPETLVKQLASISNNAEQTYRAANRLRNQINSELRKKARRSCEVQRTQIGIDC